ncbi:MAG TPA: hypothetical protein VGL23_20830, partial [Chloroflexota bacterium]
MAFGRAGRALVGTALLFVIGTGCAGLAIPTPTPAQGVSRPGRPAASVAAAPAGAAPATAPAAETPAPPSPVATPAGAVLEIDRQA